MKFLWLKGIFTFICIAYANDPATISGKMKLVDGEIAPGAVTIWNMRTSKSDMVLADTDGSFKLSIEAPSRSYIKFNYPNYEAESLIFNAVPGSELEIEVTLDRIAASTERDWFVRLGRDEFSPEKQRPMEKQEDGTYLLAITTEEPIQVQFVNKARKEAIPDLGGRIEFQVKVGYVTHLSPKDGQVLLTLDPSQLIWRKEALSSGGFRHMSGPEYDTYLTHVYKYLSHHRKKLIDPNLTEEEQKDMRGSFEGILHKMKEARARDMISATIFRYTSHTQFDNASFNTQERVRQILAENPGLTAYFRWTDYYFLHAPKTKNKRERLQKLEEVGEIYAKHCPIPSHLGEMQNGLAREWRPLDPQRAMHWYQQTLERFPDSIYAKSASQNLAGMSMIGKQAPELTLPDLAGTMRNLADYRGKYVMLEFWSTTCRPCIKKLPAMEKALETLDGERMQLLGVCLDQDAKGMAKFQQRYKITWPQLLTTAGDQGPTAKRWHVSGYPTVYIIDPKGVIIDQNPRFKEADLINRLKGYYMRGSDG